MCEAPRTSATIWIGLSLGLSLVIHAMGLVISSYAIDWIYSDLPLHSFIETAGSAIGIGVATLLLVMDRLGRGASFNLPIALGLISMAALDAFHAAVPLGEAFVWLHSTATFAGGALFALTCLPTRLGKSLTLSLPIAVVLLGVSIVPVFFPSLAPSMVVDGKFTTAAILLNIGGGVLMALAAARLALAFSHTRNKDDLLFAVHCLLFGGAAIMFEQSQLWDFSWWWWHGLRLLAYAIALAFGIESIWRLQDEAQRRAELLRTTCESESERADHQMLLLNAIVEDVSDGIVALDGEGKILLTNRAASDLLGEQANNLDSLLREDQEASADLAVQDLPQEETSVLQKAIAGETVTHHVVQLRRGDGDDAIISCNAAPLVTPTTKGAVVALRDITEPERLRSDLQQARKLESIGLLAAGIAHEINTPMQCVAANISFLDSCYKDLTRVIDELAETFEGPPRAWATRREELDRLFKESRFQWTSSQSVAALADAKSASNRIVEIVRAMKEMSHPGDKEKVATDINQVIRNASTISRNRWKYASELELLLDEGIPEIPVHVAEINQVLLNLIVNAADAVAERFGENAKEGHIVIRSHVDGSGLCIEVEDNGAGVPAAIREKLFDPFFTTKEVGKGTGQGLAITYDNVVNKHGGTIVFFSTEGEGTTFVVHLPLNDVDTEDDARLTEMAQALSP